MTRRPSPTDGRATIVELSERGRELMPQLRAVWCALADETVAIATATDAATLTAVLADLAAGLSGRRAQP